MSRNGLRLPSRYTNEEIATQDAKRAAEYAEWKSEQERRAFQWQMHYASVAVYEERRKRLQAERLANAEVEALAKRMAALIGDVEKAESRA